MSLNNLSIRLSEHGDRARRAGPDQRSRRAPPAAGRGQPGRLPARPRHVAEQPVHPAGRDRAAATARWPRSRRPSSIRRRLAAANPAAYLPDLASSLNNLSNRLAEAGRPRGALAAINEAVELHRAAGRGQPGRLPARPRHVAEQPVHPAVRDRAAGTARWPRSTRPSSIYRRLAAANPAAYLPDLATSLNNLPIARPRPGDRDGGAGRDQRGRRASAGGWPRPTRPPTCPTSPRR